MRSIMKCTKIDTNIQRSINKIIKKTPKIEVILHAIHEHEGNAFLVGGAVRDLFLNLTMKDLDIEVHGLTIDELQKILQKVGPVSLVGKVYGVLRVHGLDIDWSLPRTDTAGRKPDVVVDPYMDIVQALKRRDLTMNAMAINLHTFELIDPFNGLCDIEKKQLCTPDEDFFVEDPLRFYRVMQFIGRFDMYPCKALNALCAHMNLSGVSKERISDEFEKLFLRSKYPSKGFRWLKDIGRLREVLPELAALVGTAQNPKWHPEGDVFEHTMQAVDAAAQFEYPNNKQKLIMLFAALCHDLGKAVVTKTVDGTIKSIGHEQAGVPLAKELLKRMSIKKDIIAPVCTLVRYHMQVLMFVTDNAGPAAYKRLARKLEPNVTIAQLAQLALADRQARNGDSNMPLTDIDEDVKVFLKNAYKSMVAHKAEPALLSGADIIDIVPPGPEMGRVLKEAYEMQIAENITDKNELKRRVAAKYKK